MASCGNILSIKDGAPASVLHIYAGARNNPKPADSPATGELGWCPKDVTTWVWETRTVICHYHR